MLKIMSFTCEGSWTLGGSPPFFPQVMWCPSHPEINEDIAHPKQTNRHSTYKGMLKVQDGKYMYPIWKRGNHLPPLFGWKTLKKLPFKIISSYLYPFLCVEQAFSTFACWWTALFLRWIPTPPTLDPSTNLSYSEKSVDYRSDNLKHNWVIKLILEDAIAFFTTFYYHPVLKTHKIAENFNGNHCWSGR